MFECSIDNIVLDTIENELPLKFESVKVYASNPWVPAFNGILRNVEICYKGNVVIYPRYFWVRISRRSIRNPDF